MQTCFTPYANLVNDDEKWRQILRTLNSKFYHQTVTTQQIEDCLAEESGLDLKGFFNQYLRTTKIPVLEYNVEGKKLNYKWTNTVEEFVMPIQIEIDGESQWIKPSSKNKTLKLKSKNSKIVVDRDFYITVKAL